MPDGAFRVQRVHRLRARMFFAPVQDVRDGGISVDVDPLDLPPRDVGQLTARGNWFLDRTEEVHAVPACYPLAAGQLRPAARRVRYPHIATHTPAGMARPEAST